VGAYIAGKKVEFADKRIHASMDIAAAQGYCTITLGDLSNTKKTNHLIKSVATGIDSDMQCLVVGGGTCVVNGGTNVGCAGASHDECVGHDIGTCAGGGSGSTATCSGTTRSTCNAGSVDDDDYCVFTVVDANRCIWTGPCGLSALTLAPTSGQNAYTESNGATYRAAHHITHTNVEAADGDILGVRHTFECDQKQDAKVTVTKGGASDYDLATGKFEFLNTGNTIKLLTGPAADKTAAFTVDCMNEFYYQFGFYSTGTPRWNRDLVQNNHDGKTPQNEQVSLYGMKNHMQYQFRKGTANMATDTFYGIARDTFSDLNSGMGTFDVGYSITESGADGTDVNGVTVKGGANDDSPQMTTSVIAGENGQQGNIAAGSFKSMMEHAEKYAYIGKGYDRLTVTPMPDAMTSQKVTITYTGPSAGCSVTEVDRGTHESSECSGRGNCDYSTGTCLCDAGYTLEACSEQTVLV